MVNTGMIFSIEMSSLSSASCSRTSAWRIGSVATLRQLVPLGRHALPPRLSVAVGERENTAPNSTGMLQRRSPRGATLPNPIVIIGATLLNDTLVSPFTGFDG